MTVRFDKANLIRLFCAELSHQEHVLLASAKAAHEAATHEESQPENAKDTRAREASYLAGAQSARARELKAMQNALAFLVPRSFANEESIALSALVEVRCQGRSTFYLLGPHAGGTKANDGVHEVIMVTAEAALGRALIGRTVGDEFTLGPRHYEIVSIQ